MALLDRAHAGWRGGGYAAGDVSLVATVVHIRPRPGGLVLIVCTVDEIGPWLAARAAVPGVAVGGLVAVLLPGHIHRDLTPVVHQRLECGPLTALLPGLPCHPPVVVPGFNARVRTAAQMPPSFRYPLALPPPAPAEAAAAAAEPRRFEGFHEGPGAEWLLSRADIAAFLDGLSAPGAAV